MPAPDRATSIVRLAGLGQPKCSPRGRIPKRVSHLIFPYFLCLGCGRHATATRYFILEATSGVQFE